MTPHPALNRIHHQRQNLHPNLTLTGMYNVLIKLAALLETLVALGRAQTVDDGRFET
ncbi:MAG: hypothetical protein LM522_10405 [Candidatus Contendobacter sp.]|nr:hypothetical protein [Candidatus Contendobacter sp.]